MAKQLILNRGFEDEYNNYITQGSVSTNSDVAYSGIQSAQLLSTPTSIAEISQVVFFISPGSSAKFSFYAKRFLNEDVESMSNIRAEVNFISVLGTVIPPGIVITVRGRDISENAWNYYDGYADVPFGALSAQVVIRLEPPASGTSGLLVDDLALVAEVAPPAPQLAPAPPAQQVMPAIPGWPFTPPVTSPAIPGIPAVPGFPAIPPSVPASPSKQDKTTVPGWPFAPPMTAPALPGIPSFPGWPFAPPMTAPALPGIPSFPGWPFAPPAPCPVLPGIPSVPGFPLMPPASDPSSPLQQENTSFPGSPMANTLFPGLPLLNQLFPGWPFTNTKSEDPGISMQKDSDNPEPGQDEK